MSDVQAPPRPARKRRRPAVVCAECRRRKIACDRKTSCGQCALHNVECVYVTGSVPPPYGRPLRQPVSPGSQPGLAVPGERNDLATGNVGGAGGDAGGGANGSSSSSSNNNNNNYTNGDGPAAAGGAGTTTATASPLDEEEEVAPGAELTNTMVSLGERSSRFGGRLAKTRLFGRTHWMNNMDEFKDIHSLTHLVHFVSGSAIYKSMRTCKRIARVIKAAELQKIAVPPRLGPDGQPLWLETVPPRAVADRLVELYFNAFEPQFRILHMPTFRREYEAFMDNEAQRRTPGYTPTPAEDGARRPRGKELPSHKPPKNGQGCASADFIVKLILVLALGSCFYDGMPSDGANPSDSTSTSPSSTSAAGNAAQLHDSLRVAAARAIQRLDVCHCSPLDKHRLNLDILQIYCLVTLARQTTALDLGDDLTWFTTGGLLHTAFGMGLNRDPSHFKSLSFAQSEMRRRLWATILELAVQSSLDQGMPPLISTDDYDCSPPLNLDDDQFGVDGDSGNLAGNPYDHLTVDLPMHGVAMPGPGGGGGGAASNKKRRVGAAGPPAGMGVGGYDNSLLPHGEHSFRRPAVPRKGQPDSVFTHTSMQRLLCRSLPVRLRITKALNGLGAGLTYERALQLSADLLDACRYTATTLRAAPVMWSWQSPEALEALGDKEHTAREKERAGFAKLRIAFYEMLTRRFHHSLHSPFARKAGNNVQFFYSRRARIETVLRLLSFFRQPTTHASMLADFNTPIASDDTADLEPASGIPLTLIYPTAADDPCRRLWLIGRGMLKCTVVDIMATAVIEMIHQLQEDFVPGSDLTLSQRELYDTVRTIIELTHARIEAGETSVKGYLFFRGALAQVDALIQGKPVRQVILESAQQASTKAINTLRNLAARRGVELPADMLDDGDGAGGDGGGLPIDNNNNNNNSNSNNSGNQANPTGYSGNGNGSDSLDPPSISPVALQTDELWAATEAGPGTTGLALGAVAPAFTTSVNGGGSGNSNSLYRGMYGNSSRHSHKLSSLAGGLTNTNTNTSAAATASTSGPSPSHILSMSEMGTVTYGDLERAAVRAGLDDMDMDSGVHLPSMTDIGSDGGGPGAGAGGPWVDEWMMDPQGEFGLNNWFFPYNDRINNG
ncbi:hypothetical protein SCUCBS95973_000700 [Sporothrix curviconia]|uniref:Zn(2)-C6 fungal-type domain-containing protein n=1 Tax=Sporothrix curviconia TaxID=1260050 RepID=A0ABP0ASE6_9PEZI